MKKITLEESQNTDIKENIMHLKKLFPSAFTAEAQGKQAINFDTLRQLLGDESVLNEGEERFGLNWHGKKKAHQIALTPSTATLLPCPEDSVNWETTKNLFIEGDNLEVLKLLQKSYANKVKMIYIDPPYNTGKKFIYSDRFQENLNTYLKCTGQVDNQASHKSMTSSSNVNFSGRTHSNWLSMMYPRLKLARELLTADGVIAIAIDDNEISHLKDICNELFGEENFLANVIWRSGRTSSSHFTCEHEYILIYAKDASALPLFKYDGEALVSDRAIKKPTIKNPISAIDFPAGIDFEGEDKVFPTCIGSTEPINVVAGTLECRSGKLASKVTLSAAWSMKNQINKWLRGEKVIDQKGQELVRFYFKANGILQYEKKKSTEHPKTIIEGITTKLGTSEQVSIFGRSIFPFPKPSKLMQTLLRPILAGESESLVMDFFAGSGSTIHGLLNLNSSAGTRHRYIAVQLPEVVDDRSEMSKLGYKTISAASLDRIKKCSEAQRAKLFDSGVKKFTLSTSHIRVWTPNRADLTENLLPCESRLTQDRTEQNILYELLLSQGIDLAVPIERREIADKYIYSIDYGVLFACLDNAISKDQVDDIAQGIIAWYSALTPSVDTTVVFRDTAFHNDASKTNMATILKQNGITDICSL